MEKSKRNTKAIERGNVESFEWKVSKSDFQRPYIVTTEYTGFRWKLMLFSNILCLTKIDKFLSIGNYSYSYFLIVQFLHRSDRSRIVLWSILSKNLLFLHLPISKWKKKFNIELKFVYKNRLFVRCIKK